LRRRINVASMEFGNAHTDLSGLEGDNSNDLLGFSRLERYIEEATKVLTMHTFCTTLFYDPLER
jgi:hypothetical protein